MSNTIPMNHSTSKIASPSSRFSQEGLGEGLKSTGLNTPQFSEVMNLVQPHVAQEAVRAYEAHAEPRHADRDIERSEVTQAREKAPVKERRESAHHVDRSHEGSDVAQQQDHSESIALDPQRQAKFLRLMSQLSQEDLLAISEWSGDLNLQASALDSHLSLENLPKVEGISTSDMMALLNGFKELKLNQGQIPQIDGAQLAQILESQWAQARGQATQRMMSATPIHQVQAQPLNAQVNPAALAAMTPVHRPVDMMPSLELLRLSQSQKSGILRQVAQGFKSQRNGVQSVNIRLHPEDLGAVRLKVEVQGQDVRVFFSAENAVVNDLISQNLEELKAMLLEKDFNLAEASLFQDQLQQQGSQHQEEEEGEDYGSDERPDLKHRPKSAPKLSPLPQRFRTTI